MPNALSEKEFEAESYTLRAIDKRNSTILCHQSVILRFPNTVFARKLLDRKFHRDDTLIVHMPYQFLCTLLEYCREPKLLASLVEEIGWSAVPRLFYFASQQNLQEMMSDLKRLIFNELNSEGESLEKLRATIRAAEQQFGWKVKHYTTFADLCILQMSARHRMLQRILREMNNLSPSLPSQKRSNSISSLMKMRTHSFSSSSVSSSTTSSFSSSSSSSSSRETPKHSRHSKKRTRSSRCGRRSSKKKSKTSSEPTSPLFFPSPNKSGCCNAQCPVESESDRAPKSDSKHPDSASKPDDVVVKPKRTTSRSDERPPTPIPQTGAGSGAADMTDSKPADSLNQIPFKPKKDKKKKQSRKGQSPSRQESPIRVTDLKIVTH